MRRRSAFAFYRSLNRASGRADEPSAAAASVACGGCQWTFKDAAARDAHEEKCERAKARALPKDDQEKFTGDSCGACDWHADDEPGSFYDTTAERDMDREP